MGWYEQWFGDEYLELYSHRDQHEAREHIDFIQDICALPPSTPVLDVACGAGRHVIEFSRRGLQPIGVDLSAEILTAAKQGFAAEGISAPLVRADMRKLPFREKSFGMISSMFTSFGYFETDEEHRALLCEWRRVLLRDGVLFLDYLNRSQVIQTLEPESVSEIKGRRVTQQRSISSDSTRVEKRILIQSADSNEEQEYKESVRMYSQAELLEMLGNTGYQVLNCFGGLLQNPLCRRLSEAVSIRKSRKRIIQDSN